jgi:DNA modification methylase
LVLDPFAGSGTTLKIANKLNRKSIGIEISKDYCDIIIKRLKLPVQMELF